VYGSEELALVRADLGDVDSTVGRHQPRVLVDQPRLAQNVRRRVLKLQRQTPFIRVAQQSHHPLLTHSLFHFRLRTYLFRKSFPP